jgi:hypothetical protein
MTCIWFKTSKIEFGVFVIDNKSEVWVTLKIPVLESLRKATLSEAGLESGDSQKVSTCFPCFECMKWAMV